LNLAVLGHPLAYTLSPELHRAGLLALGRKGSSRAVPTEARALAARLAELAAAGVSGVNLTHPLKEAVIPLLARVGEPARRSRSVNTVGLAQGGWWGESTDGPGFVDFTEALGWSLRGERVHLLGAGGAARSLALSLLEAGASVSASTRSPEAHRAAWKDIGPGALGVRGGGEEASWIAASAVVVNATSLAGDELPFDPARLPRAARVVDLVYGPRPTPWVAAARERGHEAHDGVGMLVCQARRSLELWTGEPVPLEPLARAVGWAT
jgi:shikimate dehydrogenase